MSSPISPSRLGDARQLRHLSQSVILEEVGPPRIVRLLLLTITLSIFVFIGWTAITTLTETTKASGEVVPSGSVMAIQHLEGGIVSQILVRDGDLVEKGDVLARLDSTTSFAQLDEMEARYAALETRRERLRAFAENRKPKFDHIEARHQLSVREELAILRQQNQALANEREVLLFQRAQRKSELDVLRRQASRLKSRIANLAKQKNMHESLVKRGLVSRIVYLQTLEYYEGAVGESAEIKGKIDRARSAIEEASGKMQRLDSSRHNDALGESGKISAEMAGIRELIVRAKDRAARVDVRAPVRGIVKGLTVHTIGGVVTPGGLITEIVPVNQELVVEARVSPIDIGHISPGQKAAVKVTTFDVARFGELEGEVTKISATTFKDRQDEIYYRAEIKLNKNYVGDKPGENLVLPGMVAEVDIITGERTLLRYLLRPIFQSLDRAFSER
ncbi:MAG: HlyD family type I secretion periplasmic adaptor subunit [Proteobacteria bacterium]|nr:HlyD family type I secretion periplasmic adaptor subunit [Pseudomonadota bacterium]